MEFFSTITDIRKIELPKYSDDNGVLVVAQGALHVPFCINRLFNVHASSGSIRGQHAHKKCAQFLMCPSGRVEVLCFDGLLYEEYLLNEPHFGLLSPPGIWSQQTYLAQDTVLSVLCDFPYDEADYIREIQQFKNYRQLKT